MAKVRRNKDLQPSAVGKSCTAAAEIWRSAHRDAGQMRPASGPSGEPRVVATAQQANDAFSVDAAGLTSKEATDVSAPGTQQD